MKLFDGIQRRRVEKLSQKGYELIDAGEFDRALEVAEELERLRYSAAFEIEALAHAGKGDLAAAVRALERGVEIAPDVWLNWQLLGNYRSDLDLYAEANQAYERALECPDVSRSSVRLNPTSAVFLRNPRRTGGLAEVFVTIPAGLPSGQVARS